MATKPIPLSRRRRIGRERADDAERVARDALAALAEMTAVARRSIELAEEYRVRCDEASRILADVVAFTGAVERDAAWLSSLDPLIRKAREWIAVRERASRFAKRPRKPRRTREAIALDEAIDTVLRQHPKARPADVLRRLPASAKAAASTMDKKPFQARVRAQRNRIESERRG